MNPRLRKKEKGITLIALVITIIILLILAGVTIAALSGDNGILKNAAKAKEETEKESEAEGIKLAIISLLSKSNSIIEENNLKKEIKDILKEDMTVEDLENGTYKIIGDENREYIISKTGDILVEGVNWEETKKITQKHPEQREERNENVIGIGTDGNTVNMDLWEYTKLEDNTFALNDEESIKYVDASASNITKGYLGSFENGKIIGCVPKYISTDGGKTYQEVTNMWATFTGCEQLIYAPAIPNTVTNMNCTYSQCKNLIDGGYVSNSIIRMWATYSGCASLQKTPYLPNTVINMRSTFQDCTSLREISNIPEKVEILRYTFTRCTSIGNVNIIIPETVKNLQSAFAGMTNLSGKIKINASVTGDIYINEEENITDEWIDYRYCFYETSTGEESNLVVSGNCSVLEDILATKSENSNISIE